MQADKKMKVQIKCTNNAHTHAHKHNTNTGTDHQVLRKNEWTESEISKRFSTEYDDVKHDASEEIEFYDDGEIAGNQIDRGIHILNQFA